MKNYFKLFCQRITKDFQQRHLLRLKFLFFMHSSTILVLYPYLTIHMRELGINVEETAIMSAVLPVTAILMPPLSGMLADKIGNFRVRQRPVTHLEFPKILLAGFSTAGGLSALLLLLVPVGRLTTIYPEKVVFEMSCASDQPVKLLLPQDTNCISPMAYSNSTPFSLEACGFACTAILTPNQTSSLLDVEQYQVQIYDTKQNSSKTYLYNNAQEKVATAFSKSLSQTKLKNDDRYLSTIRKLSKNVYFFPTNGLFNFSCFTNYNNDTSDNTTCLFGTRNWLNFKRTVLGNTFYGAIKRKRHNQEDIIEEQQYYISNFNQNTFNCSEGFIQSNQHISVTVSVDKSKYYNQNMKYLDLGFCAARCLVTTPRNQVCSNDQTVEEFDMKLTFWSYLTARVISGALSGISFSLFEGAVIAILREHKADYGLQRIYATIGGMISSPLSGFLIDFASKGKGYTDFTPIFCLYAALKLSSALLILFINLEFKKPAENVIAEVFAVLKKTDLIALLAACLIMGSAWGYIESFLFWLLQDLGGSKSLMGLTITVGGLVGIPLLVLSGPIIKRIGHANVIFIGFIFYAIRLVGYSVIYNPWLCLIFESMESITIGLSFTAAVTYAAKLSTVSTDTTIQGILGGLYYGFGKGVGSLIGGYLIKSFGIRYTFQLFAAFTGFIGLLYFAFYHLHMKKKPSIGVEITKKDVEKPSTIDGGSNKLGEINEVAAIFEDALVNPAYEDTENEENSV